MPRKPTRKNTYHHGDLRNALVQAGIRLLRRDGLAELSLRGVAKEAKVSPAAPYRHFPDKHALLAAISELGFRGLHARLEGARAAAPGDLDAIGQAYLSFALKEPESYRLMFTQNVLREGDPPESLHAAGEQAFQSLVDTIVEGQALGRIAPRDPRELALASWALVHGVAMLLLDGALAKPPYSELPPPRLLSLCQTLFREGWRKLP